MALQWVVSVPIPKWSFLKNLFSDLSFAVCTTTESQSEQRVLVCSFSPSTRRRIITAYECVWMEHKCLLFRSTVQNQLTKETMLAYLSLCQWQNRFTLRDCRLWFGVDIAQFSLFQAALSLFTYPLVIVQCMFSSAQVQYKTVMPNGNRFGIEGPITLCPWLQIQKEGLVFLTLPHSSVWLSGRETLIGAPSPCWLLLPSLL